MTPHAFITKWRASALKERSASQEHFIDLCRLLDEPTPAEADPSGETYCFERGARKEAGGAGWADVWKRHHFAWEYKGRRANLAAAFERVASSFASVAQALRARGHEPQAVAHFVNRLVFCMFADDVGLLPDHMFTRMLRHALPAPARFGELAGDLFEVMATGGRVGFETVSWFNGGLFDDGAVLPLERSDIEMVLAASDLDWSEIDPSILGTLFERGLDPGKRAQLGAHYTDREKIMLLVEPVVVRPLLVEWEAEKAGIAAELERVEAAKSGAARTRRRNEAERCPRAGLADALAVQTPYHRVNTGERARRARGRQPAVAASCTGTSARPAAAGAIAPFLRRAQCRGTARAMPVVAVGAVNRETSRHRARRLGRRRGRADHRKMGDCGDLT